MAHDPTHPDAAALLPCPFCGHTDLIVEHLEGTTLHPAFRVACEHCGASSRFTDRDHIAAWNRRVALAQRPEAGPSLAELTERFRGYDKPEVSGRVQRPEAARTQGAEVDEARERERFEAHIAKDCGDLSTFGSGNNMHYRNSAVNHEWLGWLAAKRDAASQAAQREDAARAAGAQRGEHGRAS